MIGMIILLVIAVGLGLYAAYELVFCKMINRLPRYIHGVSSPSLVAKPVVVSDKKPLRVRPERPGIFETWVPGTVALAVALIAAAMAAAHTDVSLSILQLICYAIALAALTFSAILFDRHMAQDAVEPPLPFVRLDMLLLILVTAPALFLRIWHIDTIPALIGSDEVNSLTNAIGIVQGYHPSPFSSGDWDTLYLHLYSMAAAILVISDRAIAERVPSIIEGVLTVPLIYLFLRQLFNNRMLSVCGSLLIAFSSWHIFQSRFGYMWAINGFAAAITLYWLARAMKSLCLRHFVFAGFGLGFGLIFLYSDTLLPVGIVLFGIYMLLVNRRFVTRGTIAGFRFSGDCRHDCGHATVFHSLFPSSRDDPSRRHLRILTG